MNVSGLFLLALIGAVSVEAADSPESKWGENPSCGQFAEQYTVVLNVDDIDGAFNRVEAAMRSAGAVSRQLTGGQAVGNPGEGPVRTRGGNYFLPAKAAERAAKKVEGFGELSRYGVARNNSGKKKKELEERIDLIEGELSANAAALAKMPIAHFLLSTKADSLRQARAACERGASHSAVNVVLQAKPKEFQR